MILDKLFTVSLGSLSYFEAHFKDKNGKIVIKDVRLEELKGLGVTKSLRGTSKFREWAHSEDGQNYLFGKVEEDNV